MSRYFSSGDLWWQDSEKIREVIREHGSCQAAAEASSAAGLNVSTPTVQRYARSFGLVLSRSPQVAFIDNGVKVYANRPVIESGLATDKEKSDELSDLAESIRSLTSKKSKVDEGLRIADLADRLDVSPKRVREALDELRAAGYRYADEAGEDAEIVIQRIAPALTRIHQGIFDGQDLSFGLVSDTHINSSEEALDALHAAYDRMESAGITSVFHAGDFGDGLGIYRGQDSEVKAHTYESQKRRLVDEYPRRKDMRTYGIGGNHDLEGDFGRIGVNPVQAMAVERDDIVNLGDYSAFVNLHTEEAPCYLHLLHPKGGMSYAMSYKAQKLVEKYREERKPAMLVPGHWHVRGTFSPRGVHVTFPGCFQWMTSFMARFNLDPEVGFHIMHVTIGPDGFITKHTPEWFPFKQTRMVSFHLSEAMAA